MWLGLAQHRRLSLLSLLDIPMHLELDIQALLPLPVSEAHLQAAVKAVLVAPENAVHNLVDPLVLTLRVTDNTEIRQLNFRFRGEDKATDVLSFSHLEDTSPAAIDISELHMELGDLVLSLPYIESNARKAGTEVAAEFLLCFVHGLLHLLGWDHDTKERTRAMFECQDRLLCQLGFRPKPTWPPPDGAMPDA